MPVRVKGEVLGHLFSSQSLSTLPNMHNIVMVEGCGMSPL